MANRAWWSAIRPARLFERVRAVAHPELARLSQSQLMVHERYDAVREMQAKVDALHGRTENPMKDALALV